MFGTKRIFHTHLFINWLSIKSFFFFFAFQGRTHGIWRFPGQGSIQSYSCRPTPQPQQLGIRATSATHTTVHSPAGSLTHWARPGMVPASSWILVGFVNHWARMRTPRAFLVHNRSFGSMTSCLARLKISILDCPPIAFYSGSSQNAIPFKRGQWARMRTLQKGSLSQDENSKSLLSSQQIIRIDDFYIPSVTSFREGLRYGPRLLDISSCWFPHRAS